MTVKVTTPTTPLRLSDQPLAPSVAVGPLPRLPACVSDKPAASGDGAPVDALLIPNRLAEFDTPAAKVAARINLELEQIDCGTFN